MTSFDEPYLNSSSPWIFTFYRLQMDVERIYFITHVSGHTQYLELYSVKPYTWKISHGWLNDWLGRGLTSREHASCYMRRPCEGHEMGCLWPLLLKPKTGRRWLVIWNSQTAKAISNSTWPTEILIQITSLRDKASQIESHVKLHYLYLSQISSNVFERIALTMTW